MKRVTEDEDSMRGGWKTTTVFGTEDIGHHFKITRDGQTRSYEILFVDDHEDYGITTLTVKELENGS